MPAQSAPNCEDVRDRIEQLANLMRPQIAERQRRRTLDPSDFDRLRDTGFFLTGVPAQQGGLWRGLQASVRDYAGLINCLAKGDPAVALVAAMHPIVLISWLGTETAPDDYAKAWSEQRAFCFQSAKEGRMWGTITSEPGSGGDIMKTVTRAEACDGGGWRLSGDKHFGSGSGMSDFMITTAKPDGAAAPNIFFMDMRDQPWDGSTGMTLLAEWDGHGMAATQSHAFRFKNYPAQSLAWPGAVPASMAQSTQLGACLFSAVIVAVVQEAIAFARTRLKAKAHEMRAYERVEWTKIVNQAWTIDQLFEAMISAVERDDHGTVACLRGKAVIAETAENCLTLLSRVVGGASFSRQAPYGQWAQDVRALGFLRPPWGLAYDQLFDLSWDH